jgi:serine phosphatase RsbU (regulator of sigma subunit)
MHRDEYYSSQNVNLEPGETLYLFSDGYQDQLGGPAGTSKRMGRSQFQALLQELNGFASLADRAQLLQQRFQDWKGFFREQNDDIVIMMIRRKEG